MSYKDILFPTDIAPGSSSACGFRTSAVELDSGQVPRSGRFSQPRFAWSVSYDDRDLDSLYILRTFFMVVRGGQDTFRHRDKLDFSSASNGRAAPDAADQQIGVGDGSTATFQLTKTYTYDGETFTKNVTKPIPDGEAVTDAVTSGGVLIEVNGSPQTENTDYTVNYTTGLVTFDSGSIPASGAITAGYYYDFHAFIDEETDGGLVIDIDSGEAGRSANFRIVEVMDEGAVNEAVDPGGSYDHGNVSADFSIAHSDGVFQTWANDSGGTLTVTLPNPTTEPLPDGGPIFVFKNTGANDTDIDAHDGTLVKTLGNGESVFLGILRDPSDGSLSWVALSL